MVMQRARGLSYPPPWARDFESTLPANRESLNRILSFERNVVSPTSSP